MPVGARVEPPSVHPRASAGPLNASFHYMRHTELPGDLAQIARDPAFVLHHTCAADHFQIGDFRQIAQYFVLHAIGKKGVLLVVTEILEREHGNSICCWPME